MKRILLSIALLMSIVAPLSMAASHAYAADPYNPLKNACDSGGGVGGSSACTSDGSDPITGPKGILKKASMILATIAGIAAVIIIIVSGFRYITSGGDSNKAASARSAIIGALVGLVIIAAAETIVVFAVNRVAKG